MAPLHTTGELKIATVIQRVAECERNLVAGAPNVRIAILRDFTAEQLVPYVKYHCFAEGIAGTITLGRYDSIQDELIDESSFIQRDGTEIVVVAMHSSTEELSEPDGLSRREAKVVSVLTAIRQFVQRNSAIVVVTTLVTPIHEAAGLSAPLARRWVARIEAINRTIKEIGDEAPGRLFVIDSDRLVRQLGWARAIDARSEMKFKAPFRAAFYDAIARDLMRIVYSLKGRSRKCVVLDCDNTLWGGVIGDDGLDGIELDPGSFPGSAYYQFQQNLLRLKERGVLLAIASKNDEANVLEVLERHPHSVLRPTDFATWQINWERKSENVARIATTLNVLSDALVFVDDNAAELHDVTESLPGVLSVLVPTHDIATLPTLLLDLPQLDQLHVSNEDTSRSEFFQKERLRDNIRASFVSQEEYLAALEIHAVVHEVRPSEIQRVAQLTQKTNQFNLTTHRYAESEIARLADASDCAVFTLTARDRFGDYGLTGVFIARRENDRGTVDSLLMSCRILSRRLEHALVRHAIEDLTKRWDLREWRADYIRTAKNGIVADYWPTAGFAVMETSGDRVEYRLDVSEANWTDTSFIEVAND